jgi:hypothetical protein
LHSFIRNKADRAGGGAIHWVGRGDDSFVVSSSFTGNTAKVPSVNPALSSDAQRLRFERFLPLNGSQPRRTVPFNFDDVSSGTQSPNPSLAALLITHAGSGCWLQASRSPRSRC